MVNKKLEHLITSRPTGVNLKIECSALKDYIRELLHQKPFNLSQMKENIILRCEDLLDRDVRDNKTMGLFGSKAILQEAKKEKVNILTHCNTGSLATGGYGTALGVIRALKELGHLSLAYCTETRPYNQGSRLTAYELVYEEIPAKLICDSAVSALMSTEKIDQLWWERTELQRTEIRPIRSELFKLPLQPNTIKFPFI